MIRSMDLVDQSLQKLNKMKLSATHKLFGQPQLAQNTTNYSKSNIFLLVYTLMKAKIQKIYHRQDSGKSRTFQPESKGPELLQNSSLTLFQLDLYPLPVEFPFDPPNSDSGRPEHFAVGPTLSSLSTLHLSHLYISLISLYLLPPPLIPPELRPNSVAA